MKNICIFTCPIASIEKEELEEIIMYNQELVEVIAKYQKILDSRNIEIFKEEGNIIYNLLSVNVIWYI